MSEYSFKNISITSKHLSEENVREILRVREKELSLRKEKIQEKFKTYLHFMLGNEEYAIRFENIKEILKYPEITPVCTASSYVLGVVNWHSRILTVISLKQVFGLSVAEESKLQWIVVVKVGESFLGMCTDGIIGKKQLNDTLLTEALPLKNNAAEKYLSGIYEGKIVVLNTAALVKDICL